MSAQVLALIASYFVCSEAAAVRVLNADDVRMCTAMYQQVKLEFVEGVDLQAYQSFTPVERAQVNRSGYAGYVAWREENPELVEQMLADARAELGDIN